MKFKNKKILFRFLASQFHKTVLCTIGHFRIEHLKRLSILSISYAYTVLCEVTFSVN